MIKPLLSVGDVFSRVEKNWNKITIHYWKVTFIYNPESFPHNSYHVIRCSKTGKEFRDRNGFSISYIDKAIQNPNSDIKLITKSEVGTKANIDNGVDTARMKRRVTFLQARIQKDTKELEGLLTTLSNR